MSVPSTALLAGLHQSQLAPADNKFHVGNGSDGRHYWLTPWTDPVFVRLAEEFGPFDFDPCPWPNAQRAEEGADGMDAEGHRGTAQGQAVRGGVPGGQVGADDAGRDRREQRPQPGGRALAGNGRREAGERDGAAHSGLYSPSVEHPSGGAAMKALRNGRTSPAPGSARFVPLAIDHDRWMGSTLLCGIMVGPLLLGATEYDYLHFPAGLALGLWIAMWIIWLWAWLASKVKPNPAVEHRPTGQGGNDEARK